MPAVHRILIFSTHVLKFLCDSAPGYPSKPDAWKPVGVRSFCWYTHDGGATGLKDSSYPINFVCTYRGINTWPDSWYYGICWKLADKITRRRCSKHQVNFKPDCSPGLSKRRKHSYWEGNPWFFLRKGSGAGCLQHGARASRRGCSCDTYYRPLAITAPAAMFVKNDIKKYFFKQTKIENRYKAIVKAIEKSRISSSRHGSSSSASPPTDTSDKQKTNSRRYSDLRSAEDQESSRRRTKSHKTQRKKGRDRHYHHCRSSPSPKVSLAYKSIPRLKFIVPIIERHRAAVDYEPYWVIHKSQHYHNDDTSETHKLRKKITVQMMDHSFSGKDLI